MAVLALVQEARDAGLTVLVDGGELVIRGPRRLAELVRKLIDHKADVLAELRGIAIAGSAGDGFDGCDMQHGTEDFLVGKVRPFRGQANVQSAPDQPSELRMANLVGIAARHDHPERFKGSVGQLVFEDGSTHAPIVACEAVREQPASNPPLTRRARRFECCRRLIGNGFAPILPTIPPAAIRATPAVLCPYCGLRPVLPELRRLTDERCYGCWTAEQRSGTRS